MRPPPWLPAHLRVVETLAKRPSVAEQQDATEGHTKRPRGRAPKGKTWDPWQGWVDCTAGATDWAFTMAAKPDPTLPCRRHERCCRGLRHRGRCKLVGDVGVSEAAWAAAPRRLAPSMAPSVHALGCRPQVHPQAYEPGAAPWLASVRAGPSPVGRPARAPPRGRKLRAGAVCSRCGGFKAAAASKCMTPCQGGKTLFAKSRTEDDVLEGRGVDTDGSDKIGATDDAGRAERPLAGSTAMAKATGRYWALLLGPVGALQRMPAV